MIMATREFRLLGFSLRAERADAGERQARKAPLPGTLQRTSLAGTDGKEQFKVFAVGERLIGCDPGSEGELLAQNLEAAAAGGREAGKIGRQTIAQVHHRP